MGGKAEKPARRNFTSRLNSQLRHRPKDGPAEARVFQRRGPKHKSVPINPKVEKADPASQAAFYDMALNQEPTTKMSQKGILKLGGTIIPTKDC